MPLSAIYLITFLGLLKHYLSLNRLPRRLYLITSIKNLELEKYFRKYLI